MIQDLCLTVTHAQVSYLAALEDLYGELPSADKPANKQSSSRSASASRLTSASSAQTFCLAVGTKRFNPVFKALYDRSLHRHGHGHGHSHGHGRGHGHGRHSGGRPRSNSREHSVCCLVVVTVVLIFVLLLCLLIRQQTIVNPSICLANMTCVAWFDRFANAHVWTPKLMLLLLLLPWLPCCQHQKHRSLPRSHAQCKVFTVTTVNSKSTEARFFVDDADDARAVFNVLANLSSKMSRSVRVSA